MTTLPDEEKTKQPIAPSEEEEEDIEALAEPPDWLPDGWIMEVYRGNDGAINRVCLISNIWSYYSYDSKKYIYALWIDASLTPPPPNFCTTVIFWIFF